MDGVTSESLQEAARKYLKADRYVLGVLKPEPAAAEEAMAEAAGDTAGD